MLCKICCRPSCSGSWRSVTGCGASARWATTVPPFQPASVSLYWMFEPYLFSAVGCEQKEMEQKDRLLQQLKHRLEEGQKSQVCYLVQHLKTENWNVLSNSVHISTHLSQNEYWNSFCCRRIKVWSYSFFSFCCIPVTKNLRPGGGEASSRFITLWLCQQSEHQVHIHSASGRHAFRHVSQMTPFLLVPLCRFPRILKTMDILTLEMRLPPWQTWVLALLNVLQSVGLFMLLPVSRFAQSIT